MTKVNQLTAWSKLHSDVTPLDGTDRDSPTFGDLRALLVENERLREGLLKARSRISEHHSVTPGHVGNGAIVNGWLAELDTLLGDS